MAATEGLVFDGLDLNPASGVWTVEAFDCPPANKRTEWAQGADADGALLVRDPLLDNRTVTFRLRVNQQADMNTALAQVLALSKKIEECELQPDGLGLVWTPANATVNFTFYVLSGAITGVPVTAVGDDAGWFLRSPVVNVQLTCKSAGYGPWFAGNLLTNGSVETDLSGWTLTGGVPDPTTVSGLYSRWRADDLGLADGTAVGSWAGTGSHGGTWTQATAGKKPIYKTNILNGHAVVRGTAANATEMSGVDLSALTAGTVFVVFKVNNDPPTPTDVSTGLYRFGASGASGIHVPYTDGVIYDDFGSTVRKTTVNPTPSLTTSRIYCVTSKASEWKSYLDGSQIFTTATNTVGFTNTAWLFSDGSVHYLDGDIAEVLVYDSVLSTADRQTVENYLKYQYAVAGGYTPATLARSNAWSSAGTWSARFTATKSTDTLDSPSFAVTGGATYSALVSYNATTITSGTVAIVARWSTGGTQTLGTISAAGSGSFSGTFTVAGGATTATIRAVPSGAGTYDLALDGVIAVAGSTIPTVYSDPLTVTATTPLLTLTLAGVSGDLPAEGRLQITDGAAQTRRYAEFGLEQLYYNSATSLEIDSASLTTSGFGGSTTTRSGSYNTNIIRGTLYGTPVAVCGTGRQAHVGTFRVKARVYASASDVQARLTWQDGDGAYRSNPWKQTITTGSWCELDLGLVTISTATLGTQTWQGRIDAYATTTAAPTIDVDYLLLIPAFEGYGRARGAYSYVTGVLGGYDDFNSLGAGSNLSARTAGVGGTWATSGDTTDLQGYASSLLSRATTTDAANGRLALLGSTTYTDVDASILLNTTLTQSGTQHRVIARYVDASNYLSAFLTYNTLSIVKTISGVDTTIATYTNTNGVYATNTWYQLQLIAFATGRVICRLLIGESGTTVAQLLEASDSTVATGGTLAAGKNGFEDRGGSTASTRYYNNFAALTPPAEPVVIYSGRQAEIRYDGTIRQDSTGTYYGPVPAYRGSRFLIPPAGDKNRTSRVAAKAHRNNIETADAANVTDSTTLTVVYRPRYNVIPGVS